MQFNDEQVRLHNKLLTEINDNMDKYSDEYAAFRMHITKPLGGAGVLGRCKDMLDICRQLSVRGKLAVLRYDELKQALLDSHNDNVATLIDEWEVDIRAAATSTATPTATTTTTTYNTTTTNIATRDVNTDSIQQEGTLSTLKRKVEGECPEPTPKRKFEEKDIDPSDGKFVTKNGLGYYDTTGKTGFLLILNFTANRPGLQRDVSLLTEFFERSLGFDTVLVPRSETGQTPDDLSSDQVTLILTTVRDYLKRNAEKYYCFMCVVLSHGDDGVFETANGGIYSVKTVRRMFCNESMQEFAGKPKIFIIQACQGSEEQPTVVINDEADTLDNARNNKPQIDESDIECYIPNDADVLFIFATTPGYVVAANALEERTFLIHRMEAVFREWYQHLHLEDMLITLRNEISREITLRPMMPYSWSTLTHRLRFVTTARRNWGSLSLHRPLRTLGSNVSVSIDSVLIE